MKNFLYETKQRAVMAKDNVAAKVMTNPAFAKAAATAAMFSVMLNNSAMAAEGGLNLNGGIQSMVKLVSGLVSGVGIIYAIIAVFNWVSAMKNEEPERASKAIVNVFVAILLALVGPIAAMLLAAFGVSNTYGLG